VKGGRPLSQSGKTKFRITKEAVRHAYERARKSKSVGIDGQTIRQFEADLEGNLTRLWKRLASGDYAPTPLRRIAIHKPGGGWRILGIPNVTDQIAQYVVINHLEPRVSTIFHDNLFNRNGKSAADAVEAASKRCLQHDWVLCLDIKDFFYSIDHAKLLPMIQKYTDQKWVLLYIDRWLKNPQKNNRGVLFKSAGVSPGAVISHLLADLYLYHAFDEWMQTNYPHVPFGRFVDDILCHCKSENEAKRLLASITRRLSRYRLQPNPTKTKIVYCKDDRRKGDYPHVSFDYLKRHFKARKMSTKDGKERWIFCARRLSSRVFTGATVTNSNSFVPMSNQFASSVWINPEVKAHNP
jgi:RNA-directed DNA polymerase